MEAEKRAQEAAGDAGDGSSQGTPPISPMQQVEEVSIAMAMDTNKESLKRKLMLRRSVNELVDQGIYPPLKTPPAYAEQRKQLERAQLGDQLRHKIQMRPNRESLVQQHILEDTNPMLDSSLQARQRQLKRARLQDSLSDRLANRPGPLELVKGNILQVDPILQDAIHDGSLNFLNTTEGLFSTSNSFLFEDESSNDSDGEIPHPPTSDQVSTSEIPVLQMQASITTEGLGQSVPTSGIPTPPDITPLLQKMSQSTTMQSGRSFIFSKQTVPSITSQSFTTTNNTQAIGNVVFSTSSSTSGKISQSNSGSTSSKVNRIKKAKPKASVPKKKKVPTATLR